MKLLIPLLVFLFILGCQKQKIFPQVIDISEDVWVVDLGSKYRHPEGKMLLEYLAALEAQQRGCEYFEFNYAITGELSKSASYICIRDDDLIKDRTMNSKETIKYFEHKYGSHKINI